MYKRLAVRLSPHYYFDILLQNVILIEYDHSRNYKSGMEDERPLSDTAVEQSGEGPGNQPGRLSRSATTEKSGEGPGNQPGGYLEFSLS